MTWLHSSAAERTGSCRGQLICCTASKGDGFNCNAGTGYSLLKTAAVPQETSVGFREDGCAPLPGKEWEPGLDFAVQILAQGDCSLEIQSPGNLTHPTGAL